MKVTDISNTHEEIRWKNHSTRTAKDLLAKVVSYIVLFLMAGILISIFVYIIDNGGTHITLTMLVTQGNSISGGLANAILGTWMLVAIGLVISVIPGVFGALYLVNTRANSRFTRAVGLLTDILTSVPSIVLGLFGYLVLVIQFNFGFSLLAGGITLGIMMLPYVLRITEQSYRSVPREQVEGAYALGGSTLTAFSRIYFPQSLLGIISGILLAVSIGSGETAQLLYTNSFSYFYPTGLTGPGSATGYLTWVVYSGTYIYTGSQYTQDLAYAAAMILLVTVAIIVIASKYIGGKKHG